MNYGDKTTAVQRLGKVNVTPHLIALVCLIILGGFLN